MIDNKGKLFGKINIFDLTVILLIIVIAVGTVYKFRSPNTSMSGGNSEIEFTVKFENLSDFAEKYYVIGNSAYDENTGQRLGEIVAVRSEPYRKEINLTSGGIAFSEVPNKINLFVTIKGVGLETDMSYLIEGTYELKNGSGVQMKTKYTTSSGFVYDINTLNQ